MCMLHKKGEIKIQHCKNITITIQLYAILSKICCISVRPNGKLNITGEIKSLKTGEMIQNEKECKE